MTDEDFEKQLKEDFKNIINAMQSKSGEDIVGCPVCSGRTTYAKFRQFHAIASESGRFVGNIEERQRIEKLIDDVFERQCVLIDSFYASSGDMATAEGIKSDVMQVKKELLKEIKGDGT